MSTDSLRHRDSTSLYSSSTGNQRKLDYRADGARLEGEQINASLSTTRPAAADRAASPSISMPSTAALPNILPPTSVRVLKASSEKQNQAMLEQSINTIETYRHASRDELNQRLRYLEAEWDMERLLEFNASIVGMIGMVLALTVSWAWIIFAGGVSAFLFQHAVTGWCPPVPVFRALVSTLYCSVLV